MKTKKTEILPYVLMPKEKKEPLVLYRSYDITAVCGRRGEKAGTYQGKPMRLHLSGEGECPLVRIALLALTAVSTMMLVSACGKLLCAARYKRRYQKKYTQKLKEKEHKLAHRLQKEKEKTILLRADKMGNLQREVCSACK